MKASERYLIAALSLGTVVGLGLLVMVTRDRGSASTAPAAPPAEASVASARPPVPPGGYRWEIGERRTYAVDFTWQGTAGSAGKQTTSGATQAEVTFTTLAVTAGEITEFAVVTPKSLRLNATIGGKMMDRTETDPSRFGNLLIEIKREPGGRMLDAAILGRENGKPEDPFLRALLLKGQLVLPAGGVADTDAWRTEEFAGGERYAAEYAREKSGERLAIRKKGQFTATRSNMANELQGQGTLEAAYIFNPAIGQTERVELTETRSETETGGAKRKVMDGSLKLIAMLTARQKLGVADLDQVRAQLAQVATQRIVFGVKPTSGDPAQARRYAALAGRKTGAQMVSEYLSSRNSEMLDAFFDRHPGELAALAEAVARLDPTDERSMRALSELKRVGTPAAQDALRKVLQARVANGADVGDALTQLASVAQPTTESEAYVHELTRNPNAAVAEAADLGMGIIAYSVRGDAARAGAIAAEYVDRFQNPRTPDDVDRALSALGNSGSPKTLAVVEPMLTHASVEVRQRAVQVLRNVDGATADQKILSALKSDEAPMVRLAAARALEFRTFTAETSSTFAETWRTEKTGEVRGAMLAAIRYNESALAQPAIQKVFEDAKADTHEAVRGIASEPPAAELPPPPQTGPRSSR